MAPKCCCASPTTSPASLKTLLASARAIDECNALRLPMFLEPLPVVRDRQGWTVCKDAEALARLAGVASALGDSSRYLWLKLPYCEGYEMVARATTLPILLLGGESAGGPDAVPEPAGPRARRRAAMCAARWWAETFSIPATKIPLAWPKPRAASSTGLDRGRGPAIVGRKPRARHGPFLAPLLIRETRRDRWRHDESRWHKPCWAFSRINTSSATGPEHRFFEGAWGIFGHGNIAGFGQALQQNPEFPYYLCRNEQAAVHMAAAFAKARKRLSTFVCVSSIGPGATNMITGAAAATINRIPVLLLPGDIFARRNVAPVLQQLESEHSQDISVNDAFKPVSRYWDRINRPDQLPNSVVEAMRVLASPAHTGAVVLALPQDVQAEAWDYPEEMFEKRVWHIARPVPEPAMFARAVGAIRAARRPLIVAGGGVIYSEASAALAAFTHANRHSRRRDPGRQGLSAIRPSAATSAPSASPALREPTWRRAMPTWSSPSAPA